MTNPFLSTAENSLIQNFLSKGFVIFDLEEQVLIDTLQEKIYTFACEKIKNTNNYSKIDYFDFISQSIHIDDLNAIRLHIIQKMANDEELKPLIYQLVQHKLHMLVGNELAMQRNCNLSIQLPKDGSSLLALHADVWSGNSPYEVVLWIPLVDCFETKSMYLLPRDSKLSKTIYPDLEKTKTAEDYYQLIKGELIWPKLSFGQAMIFSHTIPHGNRINQEETTRWTLNIRFKSLLTPYGQKGLGESFLPITTKPVTTIGYDYPSDEWK